MTTLEIDPLTQVHPALPKTLVLDDGITLLEQRTGDSVAALIAIENLDSLGMTDMDFTLPEGSLIDNAKFIIEMSMHLNLLVRGGQVHVFRVYKNNIETSARKIYDLAQAIPDETIQEHRGHKLTNIAALFNNLGLLFVLVGEFEQAQKWLQYGLNFAQKIGSRHFATEARYYISVHIPSKNTSQDSIRPTADELYRYHYGISSGTKLNADGIRVALAPEDIAYFNRNGHMLINKARIQESFYYFSQGKLDVTNDEFMTNHAEFLRLRNDYIASQMCPEELYSFEFDGVAGNIPYAGTFEALDGKAIFMIESKIAEHVKASSDPTYGRYASANYWTPPEGEFDPRTHSVLFLPTMGHLYLLHEYMIVYTNCMFSNDATNFESGFARLRDRLADLLAMYDVTTPDSTDGNGLRSSIERVFGLGGSEHPKVRLFQDMMSTQNRGNAGFPKGGYSLGMDFSAVAVKRGPIIVRTLLDQLLGAGNWSLVLVDKHLLGNSDEVGVCEDVITLSRNGPLILRINRDVHRRSRAAVETTTFGKWVFPLMEVIIQEFQNLINQEYLALKELEKAPSKPDFKNVRRMLDELTHILSQYPVAKGDDRSLIIANAAISALANLNLSLLRYLGKIDTSSTSPDTYIIGNLRSLVNTALVNLRTITEVGENARTFRADEPAREKLYVVTTHLANVLSILDGVYNGNLSH